MNVCVCIIQMPCIITSINWPATTTIAAFDLFTEIGNLTCLLPPFFIVELIVDVNNENAAVNVEFNLWTKPDCYQTVHENGNRTWFYFSIKGGKPSHVAKFNIMNLNKQAKLFSQGMHPVMRIGKSAKWQRIHDRPTYSVCAFTFLYAF